MFRRRRFRYERRPPWDRPGFDARAWKGRGPLLPGRVLNPRLQRELRRANHLLAVGDHANAAQIFVALGEQARDRGFIYPAPMLFMQAAHAFLLGDAFDLSIQNARIALEMLAGQERWRALDFEGQRYMQELDSAGQKEEAQKLRGELKENLKAQPAGETAVEAEKEKSLSEKCPYCGASLSLEQINAGGGQAAECVYCGSVITPRDHD
jgi:hypothetical protein